MKKVEILVDGWTIERIKNPFPKKWKGRWFAFRNKYFNGEAHESTLHGYVPKDVAKIVLKMFS